MPIQTTRCKLEVINWLASLTLFNSKFQITMHITYYYFTKKVVRCLYTNTY